MTRLGTRAAAAAALTLLTACLPRPKAQQPIVQYDFGPPPAAAAAATPIPIPLMVRPPDAPLWMDSAAIHYRLAYENPARIRSYAFNRWISSPMRLMDDLLRRRLTSAAARNGSAQNGTNGETPPEYVLETHVEEFAQVFDSRQESRGVVRARAVLLRHGGRQVAAQETFTVDAPAKTPDAPGGVQALAAASRVLVEQIAVWIAATAPALDEPEAAPPEPAGTPPASPDVVGRNARRNGRR